MIDPDARSARATQIETDFANVTAALRVTAQVVGEARHIGAPLDELAALVAVIAGGGRASARRLHGAGHGWLHGPHRHRAGLTTIRRGTVMPTPPLTTADLPSIAILKAGTFKEPAPLVIGHPPSNGPEHGRVARLEVRDGKLRAVPRDVSPALTAAVKDGHYARVSAQFIPPKNSSNPAPGRWYLQHVGFLGAAAPAIKGLGTVSFAERGGDMSIAVNDGAAPDFHEHAKAIQKASPGMSFWEAFTKARTDVFKASFAEGEPLTDLARGRIIDAALAMQRRDPGVRFWDAVERARANYPNHRL